MQTSRSGKFNKNCSKREEQNTPYGVQNGTKNKYASQRVPHGARAQVSEGKLSSFSSPKRLPLPFPYPAAEGGNFNRGGLGVVNGIMTTEIVF